MPGMTSTKSTAWKKFAEEHKDWMTTAFIDRSGGDTFNPAEAEVFKSYGSFICRKKNIWLTPHHSGAASGRAFESPDFINIFTLEGVPDFYEIVWNTTNVRANQAIDSGLAPDLNTLTRIGQVRAHLGAWRIKQLERAANHGVVDHHHSEKEFLLKIILQAVNNLKPLESLINHYDPRLSHVQNLENLRVIVEAAFESLQEKSRDIEQLRLQTQARPETANFLGDFEQGFKLFQLELLNYVRRLEGLKTEPENSARVQAVFSSVDSESIGYVLTNTLHGLLSVLDHANRNLTTLQGDLHSCIQEAHYALDHFKPDLQNHALPAHQGDFISEKLSEVSEPRTSLFLSRSSRSLKESLLVIANLSGLFLPFEPQSGIDLVRTSVGKSYPVGGVGLLSVPHHGVVKSLVMGVRNILCSPLDFGWSLLSGSHEPVFWWKACISLNTRGLISINGDNGREDLKVLLANLNTAAIPFGVSMGVVTHEALVNFAKSLGSGVKEGLGELLGQMLAGSLSDFSYGRWFRARHDQWLNQHGDYARYFEHAQQLRDHQATTAKHVQSDAEKRRKRIEKNDQDTAAGRPMDLSGYQAADPKTGAVSAVPTAGHSRIRAASISASGQPKFDRERALSGAGYGTFSDDDRKGAGPVRAPLSSAAFPVSTPSVSSAYCLRPYQATGLLPAMVHGLGSFYNLFDKNIFAKHSAISFVFMGTYLAVFAMIYSPGLVKEITGSGTFMSGFIESASVTGAAFASGRLFEGVAAGFTYAKVAAGLVEKILHGQSSWINKAVRNFAHDPGKYTALIVISTVVGYLVANSYLPIPFISTHLKEDAGTIPLLAYFFGALKLLAVGFEAFVKPDVLIQNKISLKIFIEVGLDVLEKSKGAVLSEEEITLARQVIKDQGPRNLGRALKPTANIRRDSGRGTDGSRAAGDRMDSIRGPGSESLKPFIKRLELLEYLEANQAELPKLSRHERRDIAELIRQLFEPQDARALLTLVNPIKQRSLIGGFVHGALQAGGLAVRCAGSVVTLSSHPWRDARETLMSDFVTNNATAILDLASLVLSMFDRTARVVSDLVMNQALGRLEALVTCGRSHNTTAAAFYIGQRYNILTEGFKALCYLPVHKLQARQTLPDLQGLVSNLYEENTSELLSRYEQLKLPRDAQRAVLQQHGPAERDLGRQVNLSPVVEESGDHSGLDSKSTTPTSPATGLYMNSKLRPWSSNALKQSRDQAGDVRITVLNPVVTTRDSGAPVSAVPVPFAYSLMGSVNGCVSSIGRAWDHVVARCSSAPAV